MHSASTSNFFAALTSPGMHEEYSISDGIDESDLSPGKIDHSFVTSKEKSPKLAQPILELPVAHSVDKKQSKTVSDRIRKSHSRELKIPDEDDRYELASENNRRARLPLSDSPKHFYDSPCRSIISNSTFPFNCYNSKLPQWVSSKLVSSLSPTVCNQVSSDSLTSSLSDSCNSLNVCTATTGTDETSPDDNRTDDTLVMLQNLQTKEAALEFSNAKYCKKKVKCDISGLSLGQDMVKSYRVYNGGDEAITIKQAVIHENEVKSILNDRIVNVLKDEQGQIQVRRIQSFSWPAISNDGSACILISGKRSGKTLGYSVPLVSNLLDNMMQKKKKHSLGAGPLMIVLCSTWKKVEQADSYFNNLVPNGSSQIKIFSAWGGLGVERENDFKRQILTGCDILITTTPCLSRLIESDEESELACISFRKCSYLVIDDADEICKLKYEQITSILHEWNSSFTKWGCDDSKQLVITGSIWSKQILEIYETISKNFQTRIIISAHLEAAVAVKVHNIIHYVRPNQCPCSVALNLIKDSNMNRKTIIFVSSNVEGKRMKNLLGSVAISAELVAAEELMWRVRDTISKWRQASSLVIIVSDKHFNQLYQFDLIDADTIFQIGVPESELLFGRRYSFMLGNYSSNLHQKSEVISHVILSSEVIRSNSYVIGCLERMGATIPLELENAKVESIISEIKGNESTELCHYVKGIGKCYKRKCIWRHSIVLRDAPITVPTEGEVEFQVIDVIDASRYSVLLTKYIDSETKIDMELAHFYTILHMKLQQYYSVPKHQKALEDAVVGMMCASCMPVKFWARGKILKIDYESKYITVFFIDEGFVKILKNSSTLFYLPEKLKVMPQLCVEVYLCNVKPVDNDSTWTLAANNAIKNILQNPKNDVSTIFRGKIKFALNNILWLGPIKPMIRIGSRICPKVALRNQLITSKYGENNPSHMQDIQNLYEESELATINLSRESWLEHYVLGETSLASSKRKVELKESRDKSSPGVKSVASCTLNAQKLCNETLCNEHSKSIFSEVRSCSSTVNDFLNDVTKSCEQSNVPSDILGKPNISQTSTNKIQSGIIADFYMKEQRSMQVVELEKNLQLNLDGKNRNIQFIQKESKMEGNFEDNCSLIKQQILKSDSLDSEVKHPNNLLKTVKKLVRKPGMIANASISIVKHLDESSQHCSKIDLNRSFASKLPIEELCSMTVIKTRENHLEKEIVNDLLLTVDSEKVILQPHRKESTIKDDCNLVEAQFVDIGEVNSKLYVDRKKSSAIVSCEAKANSNNIFTKELDANLGSMSSTNDNLLDAFDRSSMISNGDVATNLLNEPLVEDLINFDDNILESEKNLSTQTISVKEVPKPSTELAIPQNSIYDMGPTFDSFAEMELFSIHDEHNVESLSSVNNAAVVYGNNRPALNNSTEENSTVGEERMSIGDILQVEVGEIVSPLQFYIMKAKNSNLLSQLEDEIQTLIVNLKFFDGVSIGNICLAKFDDGRFYRGEVVNAQDTYCQIFYLDHGETREVDKKQIYPCPEHVFKSLPFQCLECQLANIDVPEDLLTKATDTMEMIVDDTSVWMAQVLDFKLQKNKVLYIVDLLDTTRPKNKLLVQHLIDKRVVVSNGKQLGYDNGDLEISEVTENKPLITCKAAGEFSVSDSSLKQSQHPVFLNPLEVELKESKIKTASLSGTAVTENGMLILDASEKHQQKLTDDCNSVAPITLNKDSSELPYIGEASLQCLDFSEMPQEKCTDLTDLAEKCCFTQENVVRDRLLALRNFYSPIGRLVPTQEALPNNSCVSVKRSSAQLSNVLNEGINIVSISDPVMEVSLNDFSMQLKHKTEPLELQHPEKKPSEESKDAFALKTSANEVLTEVDFTKPNTDICNTTSVQDKETQNVNHEIISNPYLFNKPSLVALQERVSVAAQQERVLVAAQQERVSIAAHQEHASVAAHQESVSVASRQERVLIADNAHFLTNDTTLMTSARSIKALNDFTGIVAKQENQQSESDEIILKEKYYSSSLESLSVNSLTNLTNSNDTTRCRSELATQSPVSLNLKSSSSEIEVPSSSFSENSPFSKPKLADKWSRRPDQGKKKAKRFNGAKRIQKHQVIPQSSGQGNLMQHINDEMPSLEDLETMTHILHPETYWKQDEERIYLRICLSDISEYECRIHSDKLIFQTSVRDIWYIFHEELFSAIDPDLSYIKTYGLFTSITLKKQQKEMWLRLLAKDGRVPWLRKDMSVTLVGDDDTDTSDDGLFRFPTRDSNHSSNSEDELKKYTMLPSEPSDDESNNYSSSDDDIFKFA